MDLLNLSSKMTEAAVLMAAATYLIKSIFDSWLKWKLNRAEIKYSEVFSKKMMILEEFISLAIQYHSKIQSYIGITYFFDPQHENHPLLLNKEGLIKEIYTLEENYRHKSKYSSLFMNSEEFSILKKINKNLEYLKRDILLVHLYGSINFTQRDAGEGDETKLRTNSKASSKVIDELATVWRKKYSDVSN